MILEFLDMSKWTFENHHVQIHMEGRDIQMDLDMVILEGNTNTIKHPTITSGRSEYALNPLGHNR